jgi:hypothetical protein
LWDEVMKWNELILITLAVLLTLPVAFFLDDWAGIFLIYLSFGLLFVPAELRHDKRAWAACAVMLLVRHAVSVTNAYVTTVYGAGEDAVGFHQDGQMMADSRQPSWFAEFGAFEIGAKLYAQFLGLVYSVFGDSLLVGQGLSVLTFLLTCIVLLKLATHLGLSEWRFSFVILYGLLPASVAFGSVTMREPYQMLFFTLSLYCAIKFRSRPSLSVLLVLAASSVCLSLLHNGLLPYTLFLICFSLLWGLGLGFKNWTRQRLALQIVSLILIGGVFAAWISMASNIGVGAGAASRAMISGQGAEYAETYRARADNEARAAYDVSLNVSSPLGFVSTAPLVFIYYMFAPFPWQVGNMLDVYAILESLLRLLLICYALAAWWQATGLRRSQYGYLLIMFFSLELLWSLGTANWGTAIRHHLVAYGVLLVMGGPGLISRVAGLFRRKNIATQRLAMARGGGGSRLAPRGWQFNRTSGPG